MNKIKKILVILILLLIIVLISLFAAKKYKEKNSRLSLTTNNIVATSKFGNVYRKDLKEYCDKLEKVIGYKIDLEKISKEEKEILIKEIVNQKKILIDAKASKVNEKSEFKTREREVLNDLYKEVYLQEKISEYITDDLLKTRYNEFKKENENKKEYKVKHILTKTEEEIKKVQQELKTKSFDDVAKKYSIDTTASEGGSLGYVLEGQTVAEFDKVLREQPVNEISKPFKTQFGWHILIKEDERKIKIPSFKDSREVLKNTLTSEYVKELTDKNIKEADIKFND